MDAAAGVCADYCKRSQKEFFVIVLTISSLQLYVVMTCEELGLAWEVLHNNFKYNTLQTKFI